MSKITNCKEFHIKTTGNLNPSRMFKREIYNSLNNSPEFFISNTLKQPFLTIYQDSSRLSPVVHWQKDKFLQRHIDIIDSKSNKKLAEFALKTHLFKTREVLISDENKALFQIDTIGTKGFILTMLNIFIRGIASLFISQKLLLNQELYLIKNLDNQLLATIELTKANQVISSQLKLETKNNDEIKIILSLYSFLSSIG